MKEAKVVCPSCKYPILLRTEQDVPDGAIQQVNCPQCGNSFKVRCHAKTDNIYDNYQSQPNQAYEDALMSVYKKIFIKIVLLCIISLLLPIIATIPSCMYLKKKTISYKPIIVFSVIGFYIWIALIIYLCVR